MRICKDLGIDDPVTWMNATHPRVLDLWIAYETIENDPTADLPSAEQMMQEVFRKCQTMPTSP